MSTKLELFGKAAKHDVKKFSHALLCFFGFGFVYSLFVLSGRFKHISILSPIQKQIDLTVLLLSLTLLGCSFIIARSCYKKSPFSYLLLPPLFLTIIAWISLLYSENSAEGLNMAYRITVTLAAFLIGYFVIASESRRLVNVFICFFLFACLASCVNIASYFHETGNYWLVPQEKGWSSYSDRSLLIASGLALVVSGAIGEFCANRRWLRYVCIAFVPLFFFGVLHGGSRQGLLIFCIVPAAVYFLFLVSRSSLRRKNWHLIVAIYVLCAICFAFAENNSVVNRAINKYKHGMSVFGSRRNAIWEFSLNGIGEKPIGGHGLGYFKMASARQNNGDWKHPHNLFLEIWLELGLLGLLGLLIWIGLFCKKGIKVLRLGQDPFFVPTLMIVIVWFLSAQVSNTWVEMRVFAAFVGILAGRIAIAFSSPPAPEMMLSKAH